MRQVTGSNNNSDVIKISVRLRSDGVPFLLPSELDIVAEDKVVTLELLTKRAMLTPREVIDGGEEASVVAEELAKIGESLSQEEDYIVLDDGDEEMVAVVIVPKELLQRVVALRCRVEYSTPLLRRAINNGAHMLLDSCEEITTIKIFAESKLLFADLYETPSTASVAYWVQRLSAAMSCGGSTLYIYRGNGALKRLLSRNFKKVLVCA